MELIHTTANFNIKDACQGVRLQQNTVSPGRYHLKLILLFFPSGSLFGTCLYISILTIPVLGILPRFMDL